MKKIVSKANPEVKHIISLHQSKNRYEHKEFIAEGIRTCKTLCAAGYAPKQFYATEETIANAHSLVTANYITQVSDKVMHKISTTKTPSGLLGIFAIPPALPLSSLDSGIVLAQIMDPGNMGTLIRSCAAMGKKTIVVVEGTDPWSPKVIQASAGTIGLVNIFQLDWETLRKHTQSLRLCALVVHGGTHPADIDFEHTLLVVGNEAHGLPDTWLQDCDLKITLPMPGGTESLNAAIAGSIALYVAFAKKH